MAGLFTTSVLLFATFSSVFDDAHALRLPFAKRAASSNSTEPPLMTLPMPLHFDSNGRYAVQVAMVRPSCRHTERSILISIQGRTNPQNFNFSISTGSGLTFAAAQSCSNCANTPLYVIPHSFSCPADQILLQVQPRGLVKRRLAEWKRQYDMVRDDDKRRAVQGRLWGTAGKWLQLVVPQSDL